MGPATTRYQASGTRRVVLLGITLGTAVLVLALWAGARPHFGNAPAFIALIVGTVLLWLLLMGAAALAVALLMAFGHVLLQGVGQLLEWLAGSLGALFRRARLWAEPRWQIRMPARASQVPEPPDAALSASAPAKTRRVDGKPETEADKRFFDERESGYDGPLDHYGRRPDMSDPQEREAPGILARMRGRSGIPTVVHEPRYRSEVYSLDDAHLLRTLPPDPSERLEVVKAGKMSRNEDGSLKLTGWEFRERYPSKPDGISRKATPDDWSRIERSYTVAQLHEMSHGNACTCPISRAYWRGQPQPQQEGTRTAMAPASTRSVPTHWHAAATATADFHPDSDSQLLDWMSGETSGILAYGEAVAEVHEHCVSGIRLDPAAMAALHDVADAAADFAEAMARAREKFRQVYEGPREFVADGGVLPKDGDFLQGDAD